MTSQKKNNSAAHLVGTVMGWMLIFCIFYGIFYFGIYLQKQALGIYDLEKKIERLENEILSSDS